MSVETDKLRKNLWDLKYQRHLQKSHAYLNLGIAISVGFPAIFFAMIETKIISLSTYPTIFIMSLLFLMPWTVVYPLINRQRKIRKKVVNWIKGLDSTGFFKTT